MFNSYVFIIVIVFIVLCVRSLASSPPTTMPPPVVTTSERPFFEIQTKNNIFDTPIFRQRDNKTNQFTDKGNEQQTFYHSYHYAGQSITY